MKYLKLLAFFIIILNVQLFAQSDSFVVQQINGKSYYVHVVEAGNTVYAIHKKYNVPIEILQKENPSLANGLSPGQKIFIPVKKDSEQELIPVNGNYFFHKVEKGKTLYSIAKEFNVQQKDIIALNPEIEEDGVVMKENQMIKIPIKEKSQISLKPAQTNILSTKMHDVKAGETLYSLSKTYGVSIDSIKLVNNGLVEGLKEGQTIYLPMRIDGLTIIQNQTSPNTSLLKLDSTKLLNQIKNITPKKDVYRVALLLSFYLEENQEITYSALENRKIYPRSTFAIEFYQGFKLALEEMSNENTKFELYLYDTRGQDSEQTQKIISKPELKKMDLIVGPLYSSNFEIASEFARQHNIPIVSPVKQSNKVLLGNDKVYKVVPSVNSSINQIIKMVVDSFSRDNLLVVQANNITENIMTDGYIKEYNQVVLGKNDTSRYSPMKKIVVSRSEEIISNLKLNGNNVIFIPTKNSTFVTNLFISLSAKLNNKEYRDCKITLIGLEEWLQFESIDLEYFQTLNVHFSVNQFVDFESQLTKNITNKFYDKFETYPSTNSFFGLDIASYFLKNLINNGHVNISINNDEFVSTNFNFYKTGVESGYENTYSRVVKFENYSLKIVH